MKTIDPATTKCDKRSIRIIKFDKKRANIGATFNIEYKK